MSADRYLAGQRALVVGGYGALGSVICAELAARGAAVAVAGRSKDAAADCAARLASTGARTAAYALDVTDRTAASTVIEEIVTAWEGLDLLVNCAGRLVTTPAEKFGEDDWRDVVDTNLTGAFWLSQAAGRAMIEGGRGGRIIHLSSVRSAAGGRLGFSAYGASKAGLNLLVKQLATEWGPHAITVNAVAPGFIATDLVEQARRNKAFVRRMIERIPLGRWAEPSEVAAAVLYFASPEARFVTGQILFVDGGVTASQ